jgi:unsaturated rhamnogalacturonyl hydrolase
MNKTILARAALLLACTLPLTAGAQGPSAVNDATAPLHLMKPDYPTPYGAPTVDGVRTVLGRVMDYLDRSTPARAIDRKTGAAVTDLAHAGPDTVVAPGDFRLNSYEWGVTYAGMLAAGSALGERRYTDYTFTRLQFLSAMAPLAQARVAAARSDPNAEVPLRGLVEPHALDDAGALCAAFVKARRAGAPGDLDRLIGTSCTFVAQREFRLPDGTLARNRPQPNTLWLDDMFMGVPALAQMGKLTGDTKYYDDAVRQVRQFSQRMFNPALGIYMHGWVQGMDVHPEFHWARANGWAVMAMVELLDVLPPDHPGYPYVLGQLRAHARGLAALQDGTGFWHQLLDRNDTYLETSATAIYAYALARAVDRGWIDGAAYAPVAMLAWNAVATKVNARGQVEGVCVGTGMGFDPAFYYYRPTSVYAAHGYGPVLLAGAEIVNMLKSHRFEINDSSLQLKSGETISKTETR